MFWCIQSCGTDVLVETVVWKTVILVDTVVWETVILVETVVWRTVSGVDSLGGQVVWCLQCCGGCMFLRRPEKAGWYLWTVLRSQLEEGADSEEELWVTDESDTEAEESDSGDDEAD